MPPNIEPLVTHLRQNPQERNRKPAELARQFDLPEDFVRDMLSSLPQQLGAIRSTPVAPPSATLGWIINLWRRLTHNPVKFVALTTLIVLAVSAIGDILKAVHVTSPWWVIALRIFVGFGTIGLQFLCIFRHGMVRHAVYAALTFAAIYSLDGFIAINPFRFNFWEGMIVFFILGPMYAFIAVPTAVLGGYQRVRNDERAKASMTRQESLERLFQLRTKLQESPEVQAAAPTSGLRGFLAAASRQAVQITIGSAVTLQIASAVVGLILDPEGRVLRPRAGEVNPVAFVMLGLAFLTIVVHFFIGFIAGNPKRALLLALLFTGVGLTIQFIPIGPYSFYRVPHSQQINGLVSAVFMALISMAGALAALIESNAAKQRRLKENDPSVVLAEILEIEWKLRPQSQHVCVMVVDAARSSVMKSNADPFEAEWSFREYQVFLDRVAARFLGSVQSTAGDGAIIEFPSSDSAMQAARAIQSEIAIFNAHVNRLKAPFELRIGLHAGEIQGALRQVEFTEVIDIAAHVEAACPLGGIAVTEPVKADLPSVVFDSLDRIVDGFPVYAVAEAKFEI
ncbi:MAG: hypothetical protein JNM85_00360 [Chthonomonas sp.]|nr:hypothetical protein [Chthonomonas sp.]